MALIRQQWRSDRGTLLSWCITVILLTWLVVGMYRVMASSGALADFEGMLRSMPPAVQALVGKAGFDVFGTYVSGMVYGGVMFITFIIFVAVYVPGLITREVDRRNSEFLLSLPVTRTLVMGVRWLGLVANLTSLTLCQWLALVILAGPDAQPARYFWASLNMFLVFMVTGGFLLLVSVFIDDYAKGVGVSAAVAMSLFFYNSMTEKGTGLALAVRKALPFFWFEPASIITSGEVPAADMVVLAAGSAVLFCLAARAFESKQIAS
jgi:ABC-2 type transport system permease protein